MTDFTCAVVAFPELGGSAGAWLESVRSAHDPQASLIRAHFTLVFPALAPVEELVIEARRLSLGRPPFGVTLTSVAVQRDQATGVSRVFLLPSQGAKDITELHDALYCGVMRSALRADIPYEPHVTVAAQADHEACESLAEQLRLHSLPIRGQVGALDVISLVPGGLTQQARLVLGSPAGT